MSADKPTQEQIQQQQQLKCPRCDSSNTKFCYFNNYSLSQPRHFCKACKRYWTRGGTLRNVPVGGGCRKKRRVKKPAASAAMAAGSSSYNIKTAPSLAPLGTINIPSNPNLFYHGLQRNNTNHNSSELMNLSFAVDHAAGNNSLYEYDQLQPQISFLGFSSSDQSMSTDLLSKSMLSSYQNLPNFGSALSSSTTISASATMASLLSSNIQQQKRISNGDTRSESSTFIGFPDYQYEDHIQIQRSHDSGVLMSMKELKTVGSLNRLNNKQIEQMVSSSSSDPNSLIWDANGFASWLDPAKSIGYSVPFP